MSDLIKKYWDRSAEIFGNIVYNTTYAILSVIFFILFPSFRKDLLEHFRYYFRERKKKRKEK